MSHHVSCNDCSLSPICLPLAVAPAQLDELDRIIHRGRPLKRGEHLFRAADDFQAVYAVRSGALKTYVLSDEGDEQVTGFYLPGEVLGMDGISTAHHVSNAKALETATVCEIPFSKLEMLSQRIPTLQHHFFSLMSNEIRSDRELHMLLSKKNADDRVASLLLSMSARHQRRGRHFQFDVRFLASAHGDALCERLGARPWLQHIIARGQCDPKVALLVGRRPGYR